MHSDEKKIEEKSARIQHKRRQILIWAILLVVVVIIVVFFLRQHDFSLKKGLSKPASFAKTAFQQSAVVNSFNWQTDATKGTLTVSLSDLAHYSVSQLAPDQLLLTIDHTHMLKPLHWTANAFIPALNVMQQGEKMVVSMTLSNHVKLLAVNSQKSPKAIVVSFSRILPKALISDQIETKPVPLTAQQIQQAEYQKAITLAHAGHIKQAENILQTLLQQAPDWVDARYALSVLQVQQGKLKQALALVQEGLKRQPEHLPLITLNAYVLTRLDQKKQALAVLRSHSPALRGHVRFYALLAFLEQENGHYALATEYYSQLLEIQPNAAQWWLGMAISLTAQKKHQAAIQAYQQALESRQLSPALQVYVRSKLKQTNR